MVKKNEKKNQQFKKLAFYLCIVGVILIGISHIAYWKTTDTGNVEIYTWGMTTDDEIFLFYEYMTETEWSEADTKEVIATIMGFLFFPISLIALIQTGNTLQKSKKELKQMMLSARNTGALGLFTIIWFHVFMSLDKAFDYLDWGIGYVLFLIGTIIFIAAAIYLHFVSTDMQ